MFHKSIAPPDFSGNQGNHQNFEKSLLSDYVDYWDEEKKTHFPALLNLNIFS